MHLTAGRASHVAGEEVAVLLTFGRPHELSLSSRPLTVLLLRTIDLEGLKLPDSSRRFLWLGVL